jgi:seryl-tRNA synthetase
MLDRKFITENADAVALNCQRRGAQVDVHHMVELELRRREMLKEVEQLNRRANEVSKSIGSAADESEREARKDEGRQLREQKDNRQAEHDQLDEQIGSLQAAIPNMSHPDAPVGKDDKANLEIRRGNHPPPEFDFPVLDHVELAENHDLIDFEAGARIAGSGFYFLKNEAVARQLGHLVTGLCQKHHIATDTDESEPLVDCAAHGFFGRVNH